MRAKSVAGEHHNYCIRVHPIEQVSDGAVERDIDVLQGITKPSRLMTLIFGIVQVPELMTRAMAVTKDRQEKVPITLLEEVLDKRTLAVDPCNQPITQILILRRAPVRGIALADRIDAEALGHLFGQGGRPAAHCRQTRIVQSPVHHLDTENQSH